jgi:hypothetical protein
MPQVVSCRPVTAEDRVRSRSQSVWDLWWTKCHCDRFFPEYFRFFLSFSFHRCSITWKNETRIILLFIFITVLHSEPRGCSPSVTPAARTFKKKAMASTWPNKNHWMIVRDQKLHRKVPRRSETYYCTHQWNIGNTVASRKRVGGAT